MVKPRQVSSPAPPTLQRRQLWLVWAIAGMLFGGGVIASIAMSRHVLRHDREKSEQALALSAEQVASTLRLALQREEDLAVSATGFFLDNPTASNSEFVSWANAVRALDRYPELLGWGEVVRVTDEQLRAYASRVVADPAGVVSGPFELIPAGQRPFYCLFVVGQSRAVGSGAPAGFDYCAGGAGEPIIAARDSGLSSYQSVDAGTGATLAVQVPFYRGGVTPSSVQERRELFVGWVGLGFDPKIVLDLALQDHPGSAVTLRFEDELSHAEFTSGEAPEDARSNSVDLGNGWTVETVAAVREVSLFADRAPLLVLFGGMLTSLLLACLVAVLGTGRARAWQLVGERTVELRHQALHDALTGLPNRTLIMDRIEQLLARSRRHDTTCAALYIDVDDFKNVNDTLGHDTGDRLLMAITARLKSALRDADTVGRMGGDEFVVLIEDASMEVAPELVAQRLLNVMHHPFDLDEGLIPLSVSASIGIAIGDRPSGGDLLRDADVALYQAKAAGKNRYEVFQPEMQTEIGRRIDLEFELRSAIEGEQFQLVYQPIYTLDDLSLVGVEALLRWNDPGRGIIDPDEFIPILEQTGQINEVGRWVLRQACTQMAAWHRRGYPIGVSVNVSGRQLDRDDVIDHIREALAESGLDPGSLMIEVTETSLMRNAGATARRLKAVKDLGVRIAVDDFGTGYSSLAYLQQFPVDCLKIDRRFTNAITSSPESNALIRTLVQLGKDLGLTTLAEGVETARELDHLCKEHVNEAQGFLLSRPMDPRRLEVEVLERSLSKVADGRLV